MNKILLIGCVCLLSACSNKKQNTTITNEDPESSLTMIVGTYTDGGSHGLYAYRFDENNGSYNLLDSVALKNPSFVVPSADGKRLYAVSEQANDSAAVAAFNFDREKGSFQLLNAQPTHGEDPCNLLTDSNFVVSANYSGGSISVFPLESDGRLKPANQVINFKGHGADPDRQSKPHLHSVYFSPDHQFLYANDLGTDAIHRFRVNRHSPYLTEAGKTVLEPGAGPRHSVFSPDGSYLYVIDELDGYVNVLQNHNNQLTLIQTIKADTVDAHGSADIHMSANGKYLYTSHRLEADGITIFGRDSLTGKLTRIGYQPTGLHPRNFNITPNGRFLLVACRDDNRIEVYRIDTETGLLSPTRISIPLSKPVCIMWVR